MADLRSQVESSRGAYPSVVFVHLYPPAAGGEWFDRAWPEARAIADPDRRLYQAFGLGRGSLGKFFGLGALVQGFRAWWKGHGVGLPRGADPLQMPGVFLLEGATVGWLHEYRHAGDNPDWSQVPGVPARGPEGAGRLPD